MAGRVGNLEVQPAGIRLLHSGAGVRHRRSPLQRFLVSNHTFSCLRGAAWRSRGRGLEAVVNAAEKERARRLLRSSHRAGVHINAPRASFVVSGLTSPHRACLVLFEGNSRYPLRIWGISFHKGKGWRPWGWEQSSSCDWARGSSSGAGRAGVWNINASTVPASPGWVGGAGECGEEP